MKKIFITILQTAFWIFIILALLSSTFLFDNPSIKLGILIFVGMLIGGIIGAGAYRVKNKSYFDKKDTLANPYELKKALDKQGAFIDKGERLNIEIVHQNGKPTIAFNKKPYKRVKPLIPSSEPEIEESKMQEQKEEIVKKKSSNREFFSQVLKGGKRR